MPAPGARPTVGRVIRMAGLPDLPERIAQAVAERVVALVADALDVNALLARVDLDAVLARTDVGAVVDRIDVAALIARIDLDALLARIDVEQLVARIDLTSTMASTAGEAADDVLAVARRTARQGDDAVATLVERLRGRFR